MHGIPVSPATLTALVVAVSFAAGLNVYATVLSLGVMARMHWVELPQGLEAVAHTWIIAASGFLFAGEFVADKIPGFDLLWNALHTFVRIPVAALLAFGATSHLSPGMQLLATALGATVATVAHGSKTAARVAVTPSPEPVSNIALSTAEDGAAIGLTWAATHHPFIAATIAAGLTVLGGVAVWWGYRHLRTGLRNLRARLTRQPRQPVPATLLP